jgi:hypothetical protein
MGHSRVTNETCARTRFDAGQVRVRLTGEILHPRPHPSGLKPAGDPKPSPVLPSLLNRNGRSNRNDVFERHG